MRSRPLAGTLLATLLVLPACGSPADAGSDARVSVVASIDVYGDIAATIGGDDVQVTSVIDDPSADPHSFESNARTQLAVSRADLVIENGGGYDDFMDTLLSSTDTDATVLNAVKLSGQQASDGGEVNEHVWYDFPTVISLADAIVDALSRVDPERAGTYAANGAAFTAQLQGLIDAEAAAVPSTAGAGVAVTEPVPGYLLDALGAVDRTPEEFSHAVEEGGDVAPRVLRDTLDIIASGEVRALVYNEQTTGAQTEAVLQAARDAGVAVVPVTETLPSGESYVSWMQGNLDAVIAALTP